jgi:hypothetical protein
MLDRWICTRGCQNLPQKENQPGRRIYRFSSSLILQVFSRAATAWTGQYLRVSESIKNIPYDDMSNFGLLNLLRHARERPSWCKLRGAASGLPSSEAKLREAFVNCLLTQHD